MLFTLESIVLLLSVLESNIFEDTEMLKVTVIDPTVRNMKGVGKASGKPYDMNFQTVWIHTVSPNGTPSPFPEKTEIILEKAEDGAALFHAPGEYTLHPSSVYVDSSGKPAVSLRLVSLKKQTA
jgi:hypothetical protein